MAGLSAEDKALRLTGLGASEISMAAGLSPFGGPFHLVMCKRNGWELPEDETIIAGQDYEEGGVQRYAREAGVIISPKPPTLSHPTVDFVKATPDRVVLFGREAAIPFDWDSRDLWDAVLEFKWITNPKNAEGWGQTGTADVPRHVYCQVQWQMLATGCRRAVIVCVLYGRDMRVFDIPRDDEFIADLLAIGRDFWRRYIVGDEEPPFDGSEAAEDYLRKRHPTHTARCPECRRTYPGTLTRCPVDDEVLASVIVDAPDGAVEAVERYVELGETERTAAKERKVVAQQLKGWIGDAEAIRLPNHDTVSCKLAEGGGTDWEAIADELMKGALLSDTERAAMVARHQRPGSRRLYIHKSKLNRLLRAS